MKADDDIDDDPLIFWKKVQQMDQLKQLTAVILTRSASSIDVKCMFSMMGLILNGKRSRLSACNLLMHCPSFMITSFSFSL